MAEPPKSPLQIMLQAAVQSVNWTYILFWQLSPQQGELVWSDGYYNGAIKTKKTMQPTEVSTEEATQQRSQHLKELYDALASPSSAQRPSAAALLPEDLSESEWFYLICLSFTFPPGIGLPGKAYLKRQHVWLTNAHHTDTKLFPRAILAKSAGIQTVVCIPMLDGVVELGTTETVEEDIGLIERIESFFNDCKNPNPMPVLSGHSTSNPPPSSGLGFHSPVAPQLVAVEEEEEEEEEVKSDSEYYSENQPHMQLDMSEDIKLGSLDSISSNLDSDSPLLVVTQPGNSTDRWPMKDPMSNTSQPPRSPDVLAEEGTNYSRIVSGILQNQANLWSKYASSSSAFSRWSSAPSATNHLLDAASQWTLKYILFTVPLLHTTARRGTPHVMSERRRRVKLNERFIVLRSLVPFVTKMDKLSILGDTIEYLKQLRRRIKELEARVRCPEGKKNGDSKEQRSGPSLRRGGGGAVAEKVEVSIIEKDALVEIECLHKEGLLLDVMQVLEKLGIKVVTVQSSINDGVFAAELRAKVKENEYGRKPSILEVKRTIRRRILD